jgi:hypothetical protein
MQPNGSPAHGAETSAADNAAGQPISDAEVEAKVVYLAGLSDIAYARQSKEAAAAMGLSISRVDKLVRSKKTEIVAQAAGNGEVENGGQGRPINLPEPKPWPHPVNGAELLTAITKSVLRYMVMEPGAAECVALWVVHTHAIDAFDITPRLALTSPRPQVRQDHLARHSLSAGGASSARRQCQRGLCVSRGRSRASDAAGRRSGYLPAEQR